MKRLKLPIAILCASVAIFYISWELYTTGYEVGYKQGISNTGQVIMENAEIECDDSFNIIRVCLSADVVSRINESNIMQDRKWIPDKK